MNWFDLVGTLKMFGKATNPVTVFSLRWLIFFDWFLRCTWRYKSDQKYCMFSFIVLKKFPKLIVSTLREIVFVNPSRPAPCISEKFIEIKINLIFYFHTFLTALSKGFMAIKPFEAPKRSVKIKIYLNFYFNTAFRNEWVFKG